MKKFVTLLCVFAMLLTLSAAAFADGKVDVSFDPNALIHPEWFVPETVEEEEVVTPTVCDYVAACEAEADALTSMCSRNLLTTRKTADGKVMYSYDENLQIRKIVVFPDEEAGCLYYKHYYFDEDGTLFMVYYRTKAYEMGDQNVFYFKKTITEENPDVDTLVVWKYKHLTKEKQAFVMADAAEFALAETSVLAESDSVLALAAADLAESLKDPYALSDEVIARLATVGLTGC